MKRATKDSRPSLVVACLLVLALGVGGIAYAKPKKKVPKNSVGTVQLKDGAVTAPKVAAGAIGTPEIAAAAVTAGQIARGAVGTAEIAAAAVGAGEIARGAVGTAEIADGTVASADLAPASVGSAQIANGAVGAAQIAAGAVGTAQIADGSVGKADLAPGTVPSQASFVNAPAAAVPIGASPTEIAELTALPAGSYEIQGKLWLDTPSADPVVTCELASGPDTLDRVEVDTSASEEAPAFLLAATNLSADLELECSGTIAGSSATDVKLVATQVGSITVQP